MPLADGPVSDGLGDMALAGAAGADDENGDLFPDEASGHEVVDQRGVDVGIEVEAELLHGLAETEGGAPEAEVELLLCPPGDLVGDEEGEEVGIGHLGLDGLLVPGIEGVEDAGQAQLLEHGCEIGYWVHGFTPVGWMNRWPQCLRICRMSRQYLPLPV